ncbi:MAG: hypothetical protein ACW986_13850 [Promethearchaeota archaeon]|jgi:hypothetical protein
MEDTEFLSLSQLFDSIGVIEKGIERIYHYLLINKRIDNLKEVCDQFSLSLKRGYKICSVLSELELVQIFDRPMKVHLAIPILDLWQSLINKRILALQTQFEEKREKCETSLEAFITKYNLEEQAVQEPVEFINYDVRNFDESYYTFLAEKESKLAIGIRYHNPLIDLIQEYGFSKIPEERASSITQGMNRIKDNLKKIDVKVIFHTEVIIDLLNSKEFELFAKHVEPMNIEFKNITIHVTDENFSNFSLTDTELIQPSFDPTNILIGAYISRNKNIYQIFEKKFNEIFENGKPIEEFLRKNKNLPSATITQTQSFVLCVM